MADQFVDENLISVLPALAGRDWVEMFLGGWPQGFAAGAGAAQAGAHT
jgi:hypothetical protein